MYLPKTSWPGIFSFVLWYVDRTSKDSAARIPIHGSASSTYVFVDYEVHSTIIFTSSRVSDFAGISRRTKNQQGTEKASKYYGTYSIINGYQQGVMSTLCYPFYFNLYFC